MTEEIIKEILNAQMKLPEGKIWHEISQLEANKMTNYNNGLKKAVEIIKKTVEKYSDEQIIERD